MADSKTDDNNRGIDELPDFDDDEFPHGKRQRLGSFEIVTVAFGVTPKQMQEMINAKLAAQGKNRWTWGS